MGTLTGHTLAGLVLVALVGAQSACAPPPALAQVTAERHTWGGLCATGPCASDLVIQADGSWTYSSSETDGRTGTLSATELDALRTALADTTVGTPAAAADDCAADWDGTSVRYAWALDDDSGTASSCATVIDTTDPLVRYLEELATSVD